MKTLTFLGLFFALPYFGIASHASGSKQGERLSDEDILIVKGKENLITSAVRNSNSKLVVELLNQLSKQSRKQGFKVAIQEAIEEDQSKIIVVIREFGSLSDLRIHGMTPLSYSGYCGSIQSLSYLASSCNNVQRDDSGRVALHYATKSGPIAIRKLAKTSTIVNQRDYEGRTPLHYAAMRRLDSVKELLVLGADPNVVDKYGSTAIDYARKRFQMKEIRLSFGVRASTK